MACLTLGSLMLPIQREERVMVKVAQPVYPIVTYQAGIPELFLVVRQKGSIYLRMAVNASLQIKCLKVAWVAAHAGHYLTCVVMLVECQAEASCV
jgi:uncharacterized membrane protein